MDNAVTKEAAPSRPALSVVVPCYNEAEVLPELIHEVTLALDGSVGKEWEMVLVDDGSKDATCEIILQANVIDPRIKGVSLSRNFGHQAALATGLSFAGGEYIGVMDCDFQDPVEVLVQMYKRCANSDADICYGIRQNRDAPLFLKVLYSLFYWMMNKIADHNWPRDAGDFSVINRKCLNVLLALPESSRMLRGLRSWIGFKQVGIPYQRPTRRRGKSKYNMLRLWNLAMQGFVSFSNVPLRLTSFFGLALGLLSILFCTFIVINRFFPAFTLFGYWVGGSPMATTILVVISLYASVLFIFLGIIGEYLAVMLQEVKARPNAIIRLVSGDLKATRPGSPFILFGEGARDERARP